MYGTFISRVNLNVSSNNKIIVTYVKKLSSSSSSNYIYSVIFSYNDIVLTKYTATFVCSYDSSIVQVNVENMSMDKVFIFYLASGNACGRVGIINENKITFGTTTAITNYSSSNQYQITIQAPDKAVVMKNTNFTNTSTAVKHAINNIICTIDAIDKTLIHIRRN